ncbi:MAG TPA: hypothetical protein PLV83_02370 [Bacilli bacterium]|nr:hypothetical protein [Bacilli bacterium]
MNNKKIDTDEISLLETKVKLEENKKESKLILTNKRIIFMQEKGFFSKRFKTIDEIIISDIKVYKDMVQIKQSKATIKIQTAKKDFVLTCSSIIEAKKLLEEIISIRTDKSLLERSKNKVKKAVDMARETKDVVFGILSVATAIVAFLHHKKK